MIGTEQHFRQTLGPDTAHLLLNILRKTSATASEAMAQLGCIRPRTERNIAYDLAATELASVLDGREGYELRISKGLTFWALQDTYGIRIKKLDSTFTPHNHSSKQQEIINTEGVLDGMGPLVFVTVGPRISSLTGLPIDFVAVHHSASRKGRPMVEWYVDLSELASGVLTPLAPVLPIGQPQPVAPAATVRRSGAKKREGDRG